MFQNYLLLDKDFDAFVREMWKVINIEGWSSYVLKENLKLLKGQIRKWKEENIGDLDSNVKEAPLALNKSDLIMEERSLSVEEQLERMETTSKLLRFHKLKDNITYQKSRARWLAEGDAKLKYFHSCVNMRRRQNHINALWDGQFLIEQVNEMKDLVHSHFELQFKEEFSYRPKLEGVGFKCLSIQDANSLKTPFGEEEIDEAVTLCREQRTWS